MRNVYTFVMTLVAFLNSIEFSLQSDGNLNKKLNSVSSSAGQNSANRNSPAEPHLRERARSPLGRPPCFRVLGYELGQLGYIRLIPRRNPNQQFEFRKYVIPDGKPVGFRVYGKNYSPVPSQEHIVLSTSIGEIFAILEYSGVLRGIYRRDLNHSRVKINMMSGAVENMTRDEMWDCPVGSNHPIFPNSFTTLTTNYDSLQSNVIPNIASDIGSSYSARHHSPDRNFSQEPPLRVRSISPPGRPPSDRVLGYALGQLGYIRLIPKTNQYRRFEFRRYVFPAEKRIQLLEGNGKFVPVPIQEHIVLSTSSGEVFAILEYTGFLRGMYEMNKNHTRIKINIVSGAVVDMTDDEIKECQVGTDHPISSHSFTEVFTNYDSLQAM